MKIDFRERTPQLIAIIGLLVIITAILIGFLVTRNSQMQEMQEQYVVEKQDLEDEYEAISLQYEVSNSVFKTILCYTNFKTNRQKFYDYKKNFV